MVVNARRVLLLMLAVVALVVGAELGLPPECNFISVTDTTIVSTAAGCAPGVPWLAPTTLGVAALATMLACLRARRDSADPRVRLLSAARVWLVVLATSAALFGALRPGLAEIRSSTFLCHRPIDDLGVPPEGLYATACGDVADTRLLVVAVATAVAVVGVGAISLRLRQLGASPPPLSRHGSDPGLQPAEIV